MTLSGMIALETWTNGLDFAIDPDLDSGLFEGYTYIVTIGRLAKREVWQFSSEISISINVYMVGINEGN